MATPTKPAPKPRTSGFCNPTLPRTELYDPHQRCHGCDCTAEGCPCAATVSLLQLQDRINATQVTLQQIAATGVAPVTVTPAAAAWTWEADVAADLMVAEPVCPMCLLQWDAHRFTDADQLVCNSTGAQPGETLAP